MPHMKWLIDPEQNKYLAAVDRWMLGVEGPRDIKLLGQAFCLYLVLVALIVAITVYAIKHT